MPKNLKCLLLVVVTLSLWTGAVQALPYSNLVVFGDSLSDSGNNAIVIDIMAGGARTPTPLAQPEIPVFPYASNRYTNGPVWAEYLAGGLGLSAQPSLAGGSNYAFGGARTGPLGSNFPFSMTDQVRSYLATPGVQLSASTLYVVEGGGNDARDVLSAALANGNPQALIQAYASNMAAIIGRLAAAGADQFLVWNTPDIGRVPAIRGQGGQASGAASGLVGLMNQALVQALSLLAPDITDGIHLFDAYGALRDVANNPAAFGFTNASDACAMNPACIADPTGYFFWDGIHPTTAGHAMMARLAMAELPEPGTALLLVAAFAALILRRRSCVRQNIGQAVC